MTDWDQRFLDTARFVSTWSKDSTQVGAVIFNPTTRSILSLGYNGFPRGVNDTHWERKERPLKYSFTVHAETNAIYNAARHGITLEGMGIAIPWYPCSGCAGAIIQSGIRKVVCYLPDFSDPRWGADFKTSDVMFYEAGLEVITKSLEGK